MAVDAPGDIGWVSDVDAKRVAVHSPDRRHDGLLKKLGGRKPWLTGTWNLPFASDGELAAILTALRDAGFAFLGQEAGWPPTEIFVDLREKGLVSGPYREITWLGPGRPILIDHSAEE